MYTHKSKHNMTVDTAVNTNRLETHEFTHTSGRETTEQHANAGMLAGRTEDRAGMRAR